MEYIKIGNIVPAKAKENVCEFGPGKPVNRGTGAVNRQTREPAYRLMTQNYWSGGIGFRVLGAGGYGTRSR